MTTLTPPDMPDLERAVELLRDFGAIWDAATLREKKKIVHTLLETVELDMDRGPVVAIEPKAEFATLFEMMVIGKVKDNDSVPNIVVLPPGTELVG